jgi:SAM-dependent methyltransferase
MSSLSPRSETRVTPPLPPENQYGHTKKLRFLIEEIGRHRAMLGRSVTVLDFGCGNGNAVSKYLIGEGVRYYGVDIHPPSLDYARAHFGGPATAFLDHVPAGVSFDIIVYADVLEHLADPAAVMRAHCAQLVADGVVVGAVPNGRGPFEIEQCVDRGLALSRLVAAASQVWRHVRGRPPPEEGEALPYHHESGHVIFFTRQALRRVIADAGLDIVRFAHGAFVGASISGVFLSRSPGLLQWNVRIANRLPYWAVSTWYFTLRRRKDAPWPAR